MALLLNAGDTVSRSYSYTQPSPLHPSQPNGTGERTANLFYLPDATSSVRGVGVTSQNGIIYLSHTASSNGGRNDNLFGAFTLKAGTYRFTGVTTMNCFLQNKTDITKYFNINSPNPITIDEDSEWFFSINVVQGTNYDGKTISNIMLNSGSTALPYEPFGYKIPISSGGVTTNVYLGEVQSTRNINKFELNGNTTFYIGWNGTNTITFYQYISSSIAGKTNWDYILTSCSHLEGAKRSDISVKDITGNCISNNILYFRVNRTLANTAEDFKTWVQQQYAAGTPVTVWYVLATEETAAVNEPLMRIGDYADSISGISIPTTAGANSLDVDTTVKPSEVTATFNGWHPVSAVHERESGQWD